MSGKEVSASLARTSPGWREFVASFRRHLDDMDDIEGFADWLVGPFADDLEEWKDWSADMFRAEWDHWNS